MPSSLPPRSVAVLIPAGGRGRRFGAQAMGTAQNKIFTVVAGKPLWFHAAERFAVREDVGQIVIALGESDKPMFLEQSAKYRLNTTVHIANGGQERMDSVRAALESVTSPELQYVAVHDAARPFVPRSDVDAVFDAAAADGAAILAAPVVGSLKRNRSGLAANVDRRDLFVALTPQVFKLNLIRDAYHRHRGYPVTDDAQLLERNGIPVSLVPGNAANIKVTHPEDLPIAEAILKANVRN